MLLCSSVWYNTSRRVLGSSSALLLLLSRFGTAMQTSGSCGALSFSSTLPNSPIPVLGLGTWRSDKGLVKAAVEEALKVGYRHIDCAQIYQNQEEVGAGLAAAVNKGYASLDKVWITSKIWNIDHRPEAVKPAALRILRELNVPKLQHLIIHWPVSWVRKGESEWFPKDEQDRFIVDEGVALEDTWREMEKLVDEGLVDTIGVSNFSQEEVEAILKVARIKPTSNQVECHPYWPQDELRSFLTSHGIALVAYSPLGNLDLGSPSPLRDQTIIDMAKKYSKTPAQLIIRWHLQKGNVVIPKSVHADRIAENAGVFDFEISQADMEVFAALGREKRQRMVNPPFRSGGAKTFAENA